MLELSTLPDLCRVKVLQYLVLRRLILEPMSIPLLQDRFVPLSLEPSEIVALQSQCSHVFEGPDVGIRIGPFKFTEDEPKDLSTVKW